MLNSRLNELRLHNCHTDFLSSRQCLRIRVMNGSPRLLPERSGRYEKLLHCGGNRCVG